MERALEGHPNYTTICWVAARSAAKSWTTAKFLARAACKRKLRITLVPGGKQEQGSEFATYFRMAVPMKKRGEHWSATRMNLKNGSRLLVAAPTEGGVESSRADVMVFEEAQLLDQDIHGMALPQAGGARTVLIYIGTSKFPSVLNDVYEGLGNKHRDCARLMTKWDEVVKAGILTLNNLMEIKEKLTDEQWREFYECEWVLKEGHPFHVDFIKEMPTNGRLIKRVMGIDNNLERHAWVKIHFIQFDSFLGFIAVGKGVLKTLSEVANHKDVDVIVVEDEGKTGSSPALAKQFATVPVVGHDWMAGNKDANVDRVIKLHEMGCKMATTDKYLEDIINKQERDMNGKLIKIENDSDYIDAWLHGMWEASKKDTHSVDVPVDYQREMRA